MPRLSSGLREQMCDDLKTAFTNGVLYLYSGTQPATCDAAESGTLLAIISLSSGTFVPGASANGINFDVIAHDGNNTVLSKDTTEVWSGVGLAAGTIGYGRFYDNDRVQGASTTAIRFDGSASVTGGDFTVSTSQTKVGSPITVDSMDITIPYK